MEYIIIDTQEVVSQGELRRRNPVTSFPAVWGSDVLEFLGVAVVFPSPAPEYDSVSQMVVQGAPVLTDKGHYEQSWSIVDLDAEVVAQNQAAKLEQLKVSIVSQVQVRLDTFAQTRNYDSILSAATYAASSNEVFKAEGLKVVELRDATWSALYTILAAVEAGTRVVSSYADIEADLPVLSWN
jgi:hypothetical protein